MRKRKLVVIALTSLLTFGSISSCGNNENSDDIQNNEEISLSISVNKNEIEIGEEISISVNTNGDKSKIVYFSSNNQVANVSSDGVIIGTGEGNVTISASIGEVNSNELTIKVKTKDSEEDGPNYLKGGFNFKEYDLKIDEDFSVNEAVTFFDNYFKTYILNNLDYKLYDYEYNQILAGVKSLATYGIKLGLSQETYETCLDKVVTDKRFFTILDYTLNGHNHYQNNTLLIDGIKELIFCIYDNCTKEQFIEIFTAFWGSICYLSNNSLNLSSLTTSFGISLNSDSPKYYKKIIEASPNDEIKSFFSKIVENSEFFDEENYLKSWYKIFNYLAQLSYALIENAFTKNNTDKIIENFIASFINVFDNSSPESDKATGLLKFIGNFLCQNFVSFEAFKKFYFYYLDFLKDNYESLLYLNSRAFIYSNYAELINEGKKYYREFYALIRYIGTFLSSLTEEEYINFTNLLFSNERDDSSVKSFISFSKKMVATFTLFGNEASLIKKDISKLLSFLKEHNEFSQIFMMEIFKYSLNENNFGINCTGDELLSEIEYASKIGINNISQEDNIRIQNFLNHFILTKSQTDEKYEIDRALEFDLNDENVTFNLIHTKDGVKETIPSTKLDFKAIDTSVYGVRSIKFTYNELLFSFKYYVEPQDYYDILDYPNNVLLKGHNYEKVNIGSNLGIQNEVNTTDLINFSTRESGQFIAFYQKGNRYYPLDYTIYETRHTEKLEYSYFPFKVCQGMDCKYLIGQTINSYDVIEYYYNGSSLNENIIEKNVLDRFKITGFNYASEDEVNEILSNEGQQTISLKVHSEMENVDKVINYTFDVTSCNIVDGVSFSHFDYSYCKYLPSFVKPEYLIDTGVYRGKFFLDKNNESKNHYIELNMAYYVIKDILNIDEIDVTSSEEQTLKMKLEWQYDHSEEIIDVPIVYLHKNYSISYTLGDSENINYENLKIGDEIKFYSSRVNYSFNDVFNGKHNYGTIRDFYLRDVSGVVKDLIRDGNRLTVKVSLWDGSEYEFVRTLD